MCCWALKTNEEVVPGPILFPDGGEGRVIDNNAQMEKNTASWDRTRHLEISPDAKCSSRSLSSSNPGGLPKDRLFSSSEPRGEVWWLKKGYLLKKGGGTSTFGRRSWKLRYFVLDGEKGTLRYFESEKAFKKNSTSSLCKSPYVLRFCEIRSSGGDGDHIYSANDDRGKLQFSVTPMHEMGGRHRLIMQAGTIVERDSWVQWLSEISLK